MFDHIRAQLNAQLSAAQGFLGPLMASRDQAQAGVEAASSNFTAAEVAVTAAQQVASSAQAAVNSVQADIGAKQAALSNAQLALRAWEASHPTPVPAFTKFGPNPLWEKWSQQEQPYVAAVKAAQDAVNAAQPALTAAQGQLSQANASLAAAQQQQNAALQTLTVAQSMLKQVVQGFAGAQQAVTALQDQLAALDTQTERLSAQPRNFADLQQAADAETAAALAGRHARHDQLTHLFAVTSDRASTLAGQDNTVDDLAGLLAAIRGWPDVANYPDLDPVVAGLDGVVAASNAQRPKPAGQRSDDVAGARATLDEVLGQLQTLLGALSADRDKKVTQLDADAKAVATLKAEAPTR